MRGELLSPRSWIIFIGTEAILAGVLWVIGLLSPWALIGTGIVLLATLWLWENRQRLKVEPIHLIFVGMTGVIIFAAIALTGVIWQYYQAPSANVAAPETVQEEMTETRQWPETPTYDIPKKLAVIDDVLEIVGPRKGLQKLIQRGFVLHGDYGKEILAGNYPRYHEEIKEYKEQCMEIIRTINNIRIQSERYRDLQDILLYGDLLEKGEGHEIIYGFSYFLDNLGLLDSDATNKHVKLFKPYADAFRKSFDNFELWRSELNEILIARRDDLTS